MKEYKQKNRYFDYSLIFSWWRTVNPELLKPKQNFSSNNDSDDNFLSKNVNVSTNLFDHHSLC